MNEPLTLNRLARTLRINRSWLREEAIEGRLPCLRIGRKLLFDLTAIKQELAQRAATGREKASNESALAKYLEGKGYDYNDAVGLAEAYAAGGVDAAVVAFSWADEPEYDYRTELRAELIKWEKLRRDAK